LFGSILLRDYYCCMKNGDSAITINLRLTIEPKSIGFYIKTEAEENECSYSAVLRKLIKDAMRLKEKKQLKNMPMSKL